ncbi:GNAT family N-acetyltransferase [Pedobacter cryotolerans]|uniref:GNAT family N-acetyltransferase n=1 Tax=Pedobacter cryotolerans TaxID=2571270 RepID=A0A4U1C2K6_9SPHI|nr:N-acetyltransferase [Pedobacter cryotolerans]TKB99990.1 GNAT family N-acetyltransferase [Pedobacter cryotolerans]
MIRNASPADANDLVKLMMLAMGDLPFKFIASADQSIAFSLLMDFVLKEGNQYCLSNTFVYVLDEKVVGAINAYDGGAIEQLRKPFFDYIRKAFHHGVFDMDVESEAGEYYIDTLAVNPSYQGKGIGKDLIKYVINHAERIGFDKVGLLVSNPDAKRLYEKLGFKKVGYRYLLDNKHEHLVYRV